MNIFLFIRDSYRYLQNLQNHQYWLEGRLSTRTPERKLFLCTKGLTYMRYETSERSQELLFNSFSEIIAILKAMGHPNRFKILVLLLKGPLSFQELLNSMNLQKSALANHLTQLKEKELIEKIKHGTYKITDDGKIYMQSIEAAYRESEARKKRMREAKQREELAKSFLERR